MLQDGRLLWAVYCKELDLTWVDIRFHNMWRASKQIVGCFQMRIG